MNSKRKEEMAKIVGAMLDTIAISKTSWRNHLAFSGKFYKYNFQNTLALQANNPNLTACADYSTWNSIGRRVNAGEKGILIYGENNSFTHVFDISATNSQNPPPYLWQFKDYHLEPIKDIMVEEYGEVSSEGGYKDLKASIENHVESACQRYISDNNPFLVGSKIERMPIERQQAVFVATMQDSVGYMAASRLNLPQGLYNNDTLAFRYLDNFNTKQSRLLLGTAVKEIGEGILRKVEQEVKTIDKKRRIENDNRRNQKNIRFTEHDNRGNNERETAETSDWQVRSDGDTVYAGERPHRAGEPSHGRKLSGTLFESGRTSLQPTGEDNGTDEETKFPTENGQLYRDGEIQQSPTYNSRGNRAKRANLHLNNAEPEGLTTTVSPFFVSKDGLYQYKVGDTVFWEGGEELVIGGVDPKSVMFGVELHRPNTNSVRFAFPVTAFESDLVRLNVNEHLRVVQEQEEKQLFDVSELKEYDRVKLSDGRVALVADIYQNGEEFRLSIPRKDMPPSRLIIGKEELSALATERLPHSGFDLFYGQLGNGITVSNRLESEYRDYKKLAHINTDRQVHFYDEDIPSDVKEEIEQHARNSTAKISTTQDQDVFSVPPITRIDNLSYSNSPNYDYYVGDEVYLPDYTADEPTTFPAKIIDFYKGNIRIRELEGERVWEIPDKQFNSLLSHSEENSHVLLRNNHRYRKAFEDIETRYDIRAGKSVFLLNSDNAVGSTFKMGAGTNVQNKLIALHHIDVPWRPSDVEQREGRILRQGNDNEEVEIYRYITEGSFDAFSWQIIENKQRFISQVFSGEIVPESMDEIDSKTFSFAEIKAMATGDPRIMRKCEVDSEVSRLEVLQASYNANRYRMEDNLLKNIPRNMVAVKERISGYESDVATIGNHAGDFSITIKDKTFDSRTDSGAFLLESLRKMPLDQNITLGTYKGLNINAYCGVDGLENSYRKYSVMLKGSLSHHFDLSDDPVGQITRIENITKKLPEELKEKQAELSSLEHQLASTKVELEKHFEYEGALQELRLEQAQLNTELIIDESPQILLDDGEEEQEQEEKIVDNSDNEMEENDFENEMER